MIFLRIWVFLLLVAQSVKADELKRIHVLEFEGDIGSSELLSLTDRARSGARDVLPPEQFQLLERENIRLILEDNEIDLNCAQGECEAETLRNIQADYGMSGRVIRIGGQFEMVLKLYDAHSSAVLEEEIQSYDSLSELREQVKDLTKRLMINVPGASLDETITKASVRIRKSEIYRGKDIVNKSTGKFGFLVISSKPNGAEITVNGVSKGMTPIQAEMPEGRYVVVAEMGDIYHPATSDEIALSDGESAIIELDLKPAFAPVKIESSPAGADVYISGERVGVTPYSIARQPSGIYNLTLKKSNYVDKRQRIIVEDDKNLSLKLKLDKSVADLRIESLPSAADIWLNGKPTGEQTPHTFADKKPGEYRIRLVKPLHKPTQKSVRLRAGKTLQQSITITPNYGNLLVKSEPLGAEIRLNGKRQSSITPYTFKTLGAGVMQLELRKPGYGTIKKKLNIPDDGSTIQFSESLTPILGTLVITTTDPEGQPCKAQVYLGEDKIGVSPLKKDVLALPYDVRVDCDGMKAHKQLTVQHNQLNRLQLQVNIYSLADQRRVKNALIGNYLLDSALLGSSIYFSYLSAQSYGNMQAAFDRAAGITDANDSQAYADHLSEGNAHLQTFNLSVAATSTLFALGTTHFFLTTRPVQKKHNNIVEVLEKY